MRKNRVYSSEQTALRQMLKELGHRVTLKNDPMPSVFLDHDISARFYGTDWLTVYAMVLAHFTSQIQTVKPKTLA